jgi:dynein heavy chain
MHTFRPQTAPVIFLCQLVQDFQKHVPLITALRNPGLRGRHWERISAAVGSSIKGDAGVAGGALLRTRGYLWQVFPYQRLQQCDALALFMTKQRRVIPLSNSPGFSLSRALQLGLPSFMGAIEEVSEYASKVRLCGGLLHPTLC